jgi:Outer membrane protein beta-barrel domain
MKKVFLFAAFAVTTVASQAQIKFGGQAGINAASMQDKSTSGTVTTTQKFKTKVGFTIGAVAEISISDALSFRPELNFTQKGGKLNNTETQTIPFLGTITTTTESTIASNYLELPLNVIYKFNAGGGNVFVGVGPSVGFGLSGKNKYKETSTGSPAQEGNVSIKFDGKTNATDNNAHLKALDFGANFLAGYQMSNNIFFKASYTLGLSNINPETNASTKNKGFGFTVGYMFGGSNSND